MRASGRYTLSNSGTPYCRRYLINLRKIVKCGICGHRQKIQFHHIKPTKVNGIGRGLNVRALDIMKHPDCYIPLCYFCHQKVTSGELSIAPSYFPFIDAIQLACWPNNGLVPFRIKVI